MARFAFVGGKLVVLPDEPVVPVAGVSGPQIGLQVPAPVTGYTRAAVPVSSGYTPGLRLPSPTGYTQGVSLPAPTGYSAGVPLRSSTMNDMVPVTPSKISMNLDPKEQQLFAQGLARGDSASDSLNRIAKLRRMQGGKFGLPADVSADEKDAAKRIDEIGNLPSTSTILHSREWEIRARLEKLNNMLAGTKHTGNTAGQQMLERHIKTNEAYRDLMYGTPGGTADAAERKAQQGKTK